VIKKPRGRGGHSPRWAAVPEIMMMMMMMIIIIIIIIITRIMKYLDILSVNPNTRLHNLTSGGLFNTVKG
jgi:hypothetical protein